jgi:hypothetical protein
MLSYINDYSARKLFRCDNCETEAVFTDVHQYPNVIIRCPACGIEDPEYIYWGKCLTEEEAWELVKEHGENYELGIQLIDMNAGYHGSRTYKIVGYPGEFTR